MSLGLNNGRRICQTPRRLQTFASRRCGSTSTEGGTMHLRSLIAVVAGVAALALAPAALAAIPSPPSGFTTTWSADFSGADNTGVSGSNWLYDTGTCYPGCPAGNWG